MPRNKKLETGVRLFPDCQNVSGIGLLNKKACLFRLLLQFDMQTLFIKQETWFFLLNKSLVHILRTASHVIPFTQQVKQGQSLHSLLVTLKT